MKNRIIVIIILLSLWLLTSCGGAAPAEEAPAAEAPAEEAPAAAPDELFVLESAVWESNSINICWENPNQNNQREREFIQAAIENTWEAVSLIDFIGWGECENEASGIRIQISDESPQTKGLGTNIDGLENGMVLNTILRNKENK